MAATAVKGERSEGSVQSLPIEKIRIGGHTGDSALLSFTDISCVGLAYGSGSGTAASTKEKIVTLT